WTIPGGRVRLSDLGEPLKIKGVSHNIWLGAKALERAILREIKEEAGIKVEFAFPLPGREKIFTRKDGTPTLVLVYWTVCIPSTAVALGGEATAHRWVKEEELVHYEFIGNVRDDIRAALRHWSNA
ncbi:MAG: NUDIX hydrolase, partial [Candidatus Sungiibacteriota bacterium]